MQNKAKIGNIDRYLLHIYHFSYYVIIEFFNI